MNPSLFLLSRETLGILADFHLFFLIVAQKSFTEDLGRKAHRVLHFFLRQKEPHFCVFVAPLFSLRKPFLLCLNHRKMHFAACFFLQAFTVFHEESKYLPPDMHGVSSWR